MHFLLKSRFFQKSLFHKSTHYKHDFSMGSIPIKLKFGVSVPWVLISTLSHAFLKKIIFWQFLAIFVTSFFPKNWKIRFLAIKSRKKFFFQKSMWQSIGNYPGNMYSKFQLYRTLRWWEIVFLNFCWRQHFFQKNHTECEQNFFFVK